MNKTIKMEYDTPMTTIYALSGLSVICASQKAALIESFTEDQELEW